MPSPLAPDPPSVGVIDGFKGNFTKARSICDRSRVASSSGVSATDRDG